MMKKDVASLFDLILKMIAKGVPHWTFGVECSVFDVQIPLVSSLSIGYAQVHRVPKLHAIPLPGRVFNLDIYLLRVKNEDLILLQRCCDAAV